MPIGIFSIYDAYNYGAFLQAYALQQKIEKLGFDSEFVNNSTIPNWICHLYPLLVPKPRKNVFDFTMIKNYHKSLKLLKINKKKMEFSSYDATIIGSDEIWNVNNKTFRHFPEFFGSFVPKPILYAPSCGSTDPEILMDNDSFVQGIKKCICWSARDINTKIAIESVINQSVPIVLDPTFLIDYDVFIKNNSLEKYILIYMYNINSTVMKSIKTLSEKKKLKMISIGQFNPYCDLSLPHDVSNFVTLVKNAEYVFTDSYHGTILSLVFNKKFCVTDFRIKIDSLFKLLGLHQYIDSDYIFYNIDDWANYEYINEQIKINTIISLEYLDKSLKKIKKCV